MIEINFSAALLTWYRQCARELPWRGSSDPYAIWVSEIMLQQTRVETVIPYYENWMQRFPTIRSLAEAPQQDVLATWEGLGYYSRARNLQRAAQVVIAQHNGELPEDVKSLQKLPGIGRYTAGAITSIAFGLDEPVLDGNVRRVFARVFDLQVPARSPDGEARLWVLASEHLPAGQASEYNQALMDLGASVCTPRSPNCTSCPVVNYCRAYALGVQEQRPILSARPAIPHYTVTAAVIERQGKILIAQRPQKGLLGGLWEFPGGKQQPNESLLDCLMREISEELGVAVVIIHPFGVYRHAYTHFRVTLHAFCCNLAEESQPQPLQVQELRWINPAEVIDYPMGKIDRQIATRIREQGKCTPIS